MRSSLEYSIVICTESGPRYFKEKHACLYIHLILKDQMSGNFCVCQCKIRFDCSPVNKSTQPNVREDLSNLGIGCLQIFVWSMNRFCS